MCSSTHPLLSSCWMGYWVRPCGTILVSVLVPTDASLGADQTLSLTPGRGTAAQKWCTVGATLLTCSHYSRLHLLRVVPCCVRSTKKQWSINWLLQWLVTPNWAWQAPLCLGEGPSLTGSLVPLLTMSWSLVCELWSPSYPSTGPLYLLQRMG